MESGVRWGEYNFCYNELLSKSSCVWLCQQCCSVANRLLSEAIALVNAARRSISRYIWDIIRSVDVQIDVNLPQISSESIDLHGWKEEGRPMKRSVGNKNSREEAFSVSRPSNSSGQKTPSKLNHKVACASIRGNNDLTTQVIENHPKSHTVKRNCACYPNNSWWIRTYQEYEATWCYLRETSPSKFADKSETDSNDRSVVFHGAK